MGIEAEASHCVLTVLYCLFVDFHSSSIEVITKLLVAAGSICRMRCFRHSLSYYIMCHVLGVSGISYTFILVQSTPALQ